MTERYYQLPPAQVDEMLARQTKALETISAMLIVGLPLIILALAILIYTLQSA